MSQPTLTVDSLVLYKSRPARLTSVGDKKIDLQTEDGETLSVRPKDVVLLHAGPVRNLRELQPVPGEVTAAWELLAGGMTTLPELAELAFDRYTPATAWATWQLIADGLYFSGQVDAITAHSAETVATIQAHRAAKAAEERAWQTCLARVQAGSYDPADERYLVDVAGLALEKREQSRVLRALSREETAVNAHALLLNIGYWKPTLNPYPQRLGVSLTQPALPLPALPDEPRRDLTHLLALAIDDEGARDPDDAISWDDGYLWVHVADAAALVPAESAIDMEARSRGANLYLPEGTIGMLPEAATDALALGLQPISPALSFRLTVNAAGEIGAVEIMPSWVRVTRLSYDEAEDRLYESPFQELYALAQRYTERRRANGAIELTLPEVKIRVIDGTIVIRPLPPLRSRDLVREAMLMTGEAVATYALQQGLALPFSGQEASEEALNQPNTTLAEMFALRRYLKASQYKTEPAPHKGLGMALYVQATSPLRRYTDLIVHQQLRAHLRGEPPLSTAAVNARIAEASEAMRLVRQVERLSNTHWKLAYLLGQPGWSGEGVVVDKAGSRNVVLIPDLDLETEIYGRNDLAVDDGVKVTLTEVNLPELITKFRVK